MMVDEDAENDRCGRRGEAKIDGKSYEFEFSIRCNEGKGVRIEDFIRSIRGQTTFTMKRIVDLPFR